MRFKSEQAIQSISSKDQCPWIVETSVHLLSHWLIILVKDRQQLVNLGYQGWWLVVQKPTIPWSKTILEKCLPGASLNNNKN